MSTNILKSEIVSINSLPSPPVNPVEGTFYYDSTLGEFRAYLNGQWGSIAGSSFDRISANEVQIVGQASAPSSPSDGLIYYDTTLDKFQGYINGSWQDLGGTPTPPAASSALGVDAYDAYVAQLKFGTLHLSQPPNYQTIIESFNTSAGGLVLNLAKDYSTLDGTTIYLNENQVVWDSLDVTTGWTTGTNTPNITAFSGGQIEGSGYIRMAKVALNGTMNISKNYPSFSLHKRSLRLWVRLSTTTNVAAAAVKVYLESSSGNYKRYTFFLSDFIANQWRLIECDSEDPNAFVAGVPIMNSITKVTLEATTNAAQTLSVDFDYMVSVSNEDILSTRYSGLTIPIWDTVNQEFMTLVSEHASEKGRYTMSAPLVNNYTINGDAAAKDFGVQLNFPVGEPELTTGAHGKTQYVIKRRIFSEAQTNKTLQTKVVFYCEQHPVFDPYSSVTFRLEGNFSSKFKAGDKVAIWYVQHENFDSSGPAYSRYVSEWNAKFKILTLASDSTWNGAHTFISFTENHLVGNARNLNLIKIPIIAKGYVGTNTSNEVLTDLTIKNFIPENNNMSIVYEDGSKTGGKMVVATALHTQDTAVDYPQISSITATII